MFLSALKKIFNRHKFYGLKSFTYFLPSPPFRKTGYQEKEFDQVLAHLTAKGYEIVDVKMQTVSSPKSSGIWILCLLGAKTKEAYEAPINVDYQDVATSTQSSSNIQLDPLIEHDC